MQNSNAVVKKIYCIVINGKIQEKLDFDSMEIAKDYIKLFSLKYRQENTIAIREIYRITTDIIIREVYQNYVQKFEIHTVEIRGNGKKEIVAVRGLP